jgi:hypothetical protein
LNPVANRQAPGIERLGSSRTFRALFIRQEVESVAANLSSVAERLSTRVEQLIKDGTHLYKEAIVADSGRCPHCDAIVPAIRPVPFEYCPYCEADVDQFANDERVMEHPLERLIRLFMPQPMTRSMSPIRIRSDESERIKAHEAPGIGSLRR